MLKFTTETKFYRLLLKISYEYGSHLRKLGVLTPDAEVDGRPVFFCDPESVAARRARIAAYRGAVREARENLVNV